MSKQASNHRERQRNEELGLYFFDYNTVERVLLMCAIIVCLSGIMFESGRFIDRPDLRWQETALIAFVMTALIGSIVYYFFVFVSEVLGFTPSWLLKLFSTKQRAGLSAGKSKFRLDGEDDDDEIEFSGLQNPMIAAGLEGTKKFEELELKLQEQEQLNLELVKLARQNKQAGGGNAAMPAKSRRQKGEKASVWPDFSDCSFFSDRRTVRRG